MTCRAPPLRSPCATAPSCSSGPSASDSTGDASRPSSPGSRRSGSVLAGTVQSKAERKPTTADRHDIVELAASWLDALAVRGITADLYRKYTRYWIAQWATIGELTEAALALYAQRRLKQVRGKTVRNELSALNRFLEWCHASEFLGEVPRMPKVGMAEGKPDPRRHRTAAPELSDAEAWAVINALPERSGRGWVVRSRAIVAYITGLRPTTLEKLRAPEHYAKGANSLRITSEIDKEGFARTVPLAPIAMDALDAVCPKVGLIFGRHQLGPYIEAAAHAVLPPSKAAVFCAQHFRSAAITRLLEQSGNLPGVQYLVGHKHASTTSRYNRPTERAARDVLQAVYGGSARGKD
jgi:integrase